MPDGLRSLIKRHLVLLQVEPGRRVRRFYSLMIERDLFLSQRRRNRSLATEKVLLR
jgi:hypothetical protein